MINHCCCVLLITASSIILITMRDIAFLRFFYVHVF
jgi:hypothetical protein